MAESGLSPPRTAAGERPLAFPAVFLAMVSFQVGAAVAKGLIPTVGALGMVGVRVAVATLVMCALARPSLARLNRPVLRRLLPYGLALGGMNAAFYLSLARLPLGLAVAIEFLGPLLVALLGSRRPADLLVVVLVAVGLLLLLGPDAAAVSPDPRGVAWALLAGLLWAVYIMAGHRVGQVLTATAGAAFGMVVATLAVLPFAVSSFGAFALRPALLVPAMAVAVLSSALPYTLEMVALRRLSTQVFGVLMSLEPALAALAGVVLLGEHLLARRWAGIACVVLASLASALSRAA